MCITIRTKSETVKKSIKLAKCIKQELLHEEVIFVLVLNFKCFSHCFSEVDAKNKLKCLA